MSVYRERKTVLDGHYASGDYECFCFDRWDGPDAYYEAFAAEDDDKRRAAMARQRVYPDDLLPEGATGYGRWTITVRFEALTPPVGRAGEDAA